MALSEYQKSEIKKKKTLINVLHSFLIHYNIVMENVWLAFAYSSQTLEAQFYKEEYLLMPWKHYEEFTDRWFSSEYYCYLGNAQLISNIIKREFLL